MARKSRKNLLQPEQATVSVQFPELDEEKIPTAIYGRLSVEDDEDNESMETQIALVQDFINRSSELNYVDTYHCSAWIFYLLGSVLLATAVLSFLMQQSQGVEALQMLIGGFVIFMVPQVVGSVVVLLELAVVMLRQVWYI